MSEVWQSDGVSDAEDVADAIRASGIEAHVIADYGWPGQIELALIDAVMSIRARYGTETSGVLGRVHRYRSFTARGSFDDLAKLAEVSPRSLQDLLGSQRSGGRLKSDICLDVAGRLVDAGAASSAHIDVRSETQKHAWTGTVGLGWVTWEYFTMLLGHPGVKADTMIIRFVASALHVDSIESTRAREAVLGAAQLLDVQARDLDHAIWRHQSGRPVRP